MMNSIYSTMFSYNTTSSLNTRKGMIGLASGINTNEMIEAMTLGRRTQIAKLIQKQTLAAWKATAFQSITTSLLDFKNKYLSSTSSLNMKNANFFQSAIITSQGANASKVSVTGTASAALSNFSILSVDQLATTASYTSTSPASQNSITTKDISELMLSGYTASRLEGGAINIKFNGVSYNISLNDIETDADPGTNAANIVDAINRGIDRTGLRGKVDATLDGLTGKVQLNVLTSNGNSIELGELSNNVKAYLGFTVGSTGNEITPITANYDIITASTPAAPGETASINTNTSFNNALYGKSITFNLDGTNRTITFDETEIVGSYNSFLAASDVADYLNDKLGAAFGNISSTSTPKVAVELNVNNELVFKANDPTSVLSLASGAVGVTGVNGVLGMELGAANRLLMNVSLDKTNFNSAAADLFQTPGFIAGTGSVDMDVNGTNFSIYKDKIVVGSGAAAKTYNFGAGTTMRDVMNTVNNSNSGIRMQYNSTTDSFSAIATETGSMGNVNIQGDFAEAIFGITTPGTGVVAGPGEDASIWVSFDGNAATQITRSSNNFTINGMNITLNGTFNEGGITSATPNTAWGDKITFTAKANTDTIVDGIKGMVNAYNDLIALVNNMVGTKPDSKDRLLPLTAEQRKELSADEIVLYEAKAKEGILFGDSILRNLASDLRFALSGVVGDSSLQQIGITSSLAWQDNGKLTIDEAKLRQAIENDAEKVADIFTKAMTGVPSASNTESGIMARMDYIMEKYISTASNEVGGRKGLLIERAGHESSPLTLTNNTLYREMLLYDSQIKALQARLEKDETRYMKQFASLETFIANMNQQSAWLSQAFNNEY